MAGTSSQEHSSCDVYREVIYEILRQGKKSYRCHMEVRSRARLQRRGDVEAQHVSPLACSCGWKNDIITDDPYSYR